MALVIVSPWLDVNAVAPAATLDVALPMLLMIGVVLPLCLDLKAAAASLGVSVWTVRSWIDEGLLPTIKFPSGKHPGETSRRVLILADDLRAFAEKHRSGGTAP